MTEAIASRQALHLFLRTSVALSGLSVTKQTASTTMGNFSDCSAGSVLLLSGVMRGADLSGCFCTVRMMVLMCAVHPFVLWEYAVVKVRIEDYQQRFGGSLSGVSVVSWGHH